MTTPLAEVDLRIGGRYRIHMQGADGTLQTPDGRGTDWLPRLTYL